MGLDTSPGSKDIFPCHNCCDRVLGCHGVCKGYAEAKAKNEIRKAETRKNMNPLITQGQFVGNATSKKFRKNF